jgi:hypothetical protein
LRRKRTSLVCGLWKNNSKLDEEQYALGITEGYRCSS